MAAPIWASYTVLTVALSLAVYIYIYYIYFKKASMNHRHCGDRSTYITIYYRAWRRNQESTVSHSRYMRSCLTFLEVMCWIAWRNWYCKLPGHWHIIKVGRGVKPYPTHSCTHVGIYYTYTIYIYIIYSVFVLYFIYARNTINYTIPYIMY